MEFVILVLVILCVIGWLYAANLHKEKQEVVLLNKERQQENERIEESIQQKQNKLNELNASIHNQTKTAQSLIEEVEKMRESAQNQAEQFYKDRIEEIKKRLDEREAALSAELNDELASIAESLNKERSKLKDLEDKQLAYLQAQQRQVEMENNQDYYRMALSQVEIDDITLLRDIQYKFTKKESIDKLIWEVYYKPVYDALMARILPGPHKVCGIYKITDLTTGQAYIGQSVDIKERFRQHIKSALAYGGATNKLYQVMKKSELYNFSFEILEEVPRAKLNEREVYWIEFYKTKEFGLNGTKGGS